MESTSAATCEGGGPPDQAAAEIRRGDCPGGASSLEGMSILGPD
jgi:hypothetical protein